MLQRGRILNLVTRDVECYEVVQVLQRGRILNLVTRDVERCEVV